MKFCNDIRERVMKLKDNYIVTLTVAAVLVFFVVYESYLLSF